MTERSERDEILDFPGADQLVAAGAVAPPPADRIAAAVDLVTPRTEREAEGTTTTPLIVLGRPGTGAEGPRTASGRSRFPRRRRLLLTAAAMAVPAAGAVAYPVLDVGGEPAATASAATRFLNEMAEVSGAASAPHGKYWMSHYLSKDGPPGRAPVTVTVYSDRSGKSWIRDPKGKVAVSGHNIADWRVGHRRLSWDGLNQLPTDPQKLKAHFPKNTADRFFQIMSLLEESPAGPRLRSALFQIVAKTPGVRMAPNVKDSRGRLGTVINLHRRAEPDPKAALGKSKPSVASPAYVDGPYYFIAPRTGRVVESTSDLHGKPTVRTTYLKVGWTDRIG
ncbi:hypothetical protein GPA10_01870 [Streptomyces sp. p1417]|uniref:CU044_5270 family protein n=1 Tax=Streptomyces typhae TaxID=2681492 RepID=A0A6L6WPD5_9ACTN|nr:hypothetical protein [Streptomyces typhae]MVO83537.1 hypothetical protein [Streptomyces typhae]